MADILTLSELKTARGETGTANDTQYTWFLAVASTLFRNFTQRDLASAIVTEDRTFLYDGSGYLDIDDAATINTVKVLVPNGNDLVLDSTYQWIAMPPRRDDSPVYTYLILPGVGATPGFSPQMGFTRNLDVYYADRGGVPQYPPTIKVNAVWGWPTVPMDIKQAAVWTINDWLDRDDEGSDLTSEAIAGYARSWARGSEDIPAGLAIPGRARDVLAFYSKIET